MCVCRFSVLGNGTLIVRQVTPRDAGVYRCVGLGHAGSAQTFAAQLVIASEQFTVFQYFICVLNWGQVAFICLDK